MLVNSTLWSTGVTFAGLFDRPFLEGFPQAGH